MDTTDTTMRKPGKGEVCASVPMLRARLAIARGADDCGNWGSAIYLNPCPETFEVIAWQGINGAAEARQRWRGLAGRYGVALLGHALCMASRPRDPYVDGCSDCGSFRGFHVPGCPERIEVTP